MENVIVCERVFAEPMTIAPGGGGITCRDPIIAHRISDRECGNLMLGASLGVRPIRIKRTSFHRRSPHEGALCK